jgi:hypothetical protein
LRRFAPIALDVAAGFLAGGSAAMLRLKASIRFITFSREPFRGGRRRIERYRAGHQRKLEKAIPVSTRQRTLQRKQR